MNCNECNVLMIKSQKINQNDNKMYKSFISWLSSVLPIMQNPYTYKACRGIIDYICFKYAVKLLKLLLRSSKSLLGSYTCSCVNSVFVRHLCH